MATLSEQNEIVGEPEATDIVGIHRPGENSFWMTWEDFTALLGEDLAAHVALLNNPHAVTKSQVGLANADNTSDANKPVSTATQTALDLKAPLASPALTGTPTAPTAAAATNTTQIATTAFVRTEVANLVASSPGALDTLDELAAALGDDPNFATTVTNAIALKAPLASPALTGTPTAPTAALGTSTTQVATTAFVAAAPPAGFTLNENASIGLPSTLSADGKYAGETETGVAGYAQAFGDLVYKDPTDSRWEKVDANAASGADGDARGRLGMVVVAGGSDGAACTILRRGLIRADAAFPTFTINGPVYASETAGAVTQTPPATEDAVIRPIGAAHTADILDFDPSPMWATAAA